MWSAAEFEMIMPGVDGWKLWRGMKTIFLKFFSKMHLCRIEPFLLKKARGWEGTSVNLQGQYSESITAFEIFRGKVSRCQPEASLESPSQPQSPTGPGLCRAVGTRHRGCGGYGGRVCSLWCPALGKGRPRRGSVERKVCVQQGDG